MVEMKYELAQEQQQPPYCDANGMRRIAELEAENQRLREAIRKADRRLDDLGNMPLGPAAAVVAEAHLYLKAITREQTP